VRANELGHKTASDPPPDAALLAGLSIGSALRSSAHHLCASLSLIHSFALSLFSSPQIPNVADQVQWAVARARQLEQDLKKVQTQQTNNSGVSASASASAVLSPTKMR